MPENIQLPTIIPTASIIKIAGIAVFKRSAMPFSKSCHVKPTRFTIHVAYAEAIINNT